jgi:hypothetical protein
VQGEWVVFVLEVEVEDEVAVEVELEAGPQVVAEPDKRVEERGERL